MAEGIKEEGIESSEPVTNGHSAAAKPLRRACDCCRKRKVKCDGGDPCGPCKKASIRCAYLQPPKKKGPKGLRSARVLHALRKIDDTVSGSPTSPLSPEQHGAFGNWGWNAQNSNTNGVHYGESLSQQQNDPVYGPHTSLAPDQTYFAPMPTSMPTSQLPHTQQYSATGWQSDTLSAGSDVPPMMSPANSEALPVRLPVTDFYPFMQLFFEHMFPIMPIIDRSLYLDTEFYTTRIWSSDMYCFISAICAATVVQLDDSIQQPLPLYPGKRNDDLLAEECLRERKTFDYIETASTLNIMTSFFIFAYYGNHAKPTKAWYYLQEAITFSEALDMDREESYSKLDPNEAQWRRRLYWLLFITERAYAVQSHKHTRLTPTVQLPEIFHNEDASLLNGFANLAQLFAAVDDNFVRAWRGSRKTSLCNQAWLFETHDRLDKAALSIDNVSETQHLDISVTREWLHMLAWQVGLRNGLIWGTGEGGMNLTYPIELAQKVVNITSMANSQALDSHGIGMEQKLSDIAHCVADVLNCTAGDPADIWVNGKKNLAILLQRLSSMRGKESRYLKPLMDKSAPLLDGWKLNNTQTLPLPIDTPTSMSHALPFMPANGNGVWPASSGVQRRSMQESLDVLRSLSMSGNFGMPSLSIPIEEWEQRRPSGKVFDEAETEGMEWYHGLGVGVVQAV